MIRLSVCAEMFFQELPFLDRIDAIADAGLSAFEFWHWSSKDIDGIRDRKAKYEMVTTAFSVEPFNIPIVDAASKDKFIAGVKDTIAIARKLECSRLIVLSGMEMTNVSRITQQRNIVTNLRAVAGISEKAGVTLVLEPLNILVDHKGYYLHSAYEGFEIVKEVDSPNVKLLYDIYHQQISEGNLINSITENIDLIGHFHVADVPGRHEPGTGEINYSNLFKKIDDLGYTGFIGLELEPLANSRKVIHDVMRAADIR